MKQGDLFANVNEPDPAEPADSAALPGEPAPEDAAPQAAAEAPLPPAPLTERTATPRAATAPLATASSPAGAGPSDSAARRRAVCDFDKPLLLEAGAGTGKTATLVARVVHWCLGPGWDAAAAELVQPEADTIALTALRGLAAITFTEAAAAEMSTRVGRALARLQASTAPDQEFDRSALSPGLLADQLPADQAVLFERSRALRSALDHLEISTIHAFCRRLIAAHPLEVGFDPSFSVDPAFTEVEMATRDVLEDFLGEAWSEPVDPDLIRLAAAGVDAPELESAIVELVDGGARAADFVSDPVGADIAKSMRAALEGALGALLERGAALAGVRGVASETMVACSDTAAALAAPSDSVGGELPQLCERLRALWATEKSRELRRVKDWGKGKFLVNEGKALADDAADVRQAALDLRHAIEPYLELDPDHLQRSRRVVGRVLERVEAELRRRGIATFADLLVEARRLLVDHPEVARTERARLRQLLVDEFQDTDAIQCDIVAALGLAPAGEVGPTLFLVGDPKQSIFAWRSADLRAYEDLASRVEAAGGARLALTCNFRSRAPILAEVERAVDPVMLEARGVQPAFVALEAGRKDAAVDDSDGVEFWATWARAEDGTIVAAEPKPQRASFELEASAIASDILQRRSVEGAAWKDFALIFRALTSIDPYLEELRSRGIPYEVQSDRKYYKRREVIDATALVRAVLDPNDQLALVTLLRSPLVGVPDAALMPLWQAGLPGRMAGLHGVSEEGLAEIGELVREAARKTPMSVPGLEALGPWHEGLIASLEALAEVRGAFRDEPVDRWLDRLRAAFLPDALEAARYLGAYRLANLERFFRDLLSALEVRGGDVHSVLRTLRSNLGREDRSEAARPADSDQDAVQILTIHGAKGLEFNHVFLAQAHKIDGGRRSEARTAFDRRGSVVAYRLFGAPTPSWFAARVQREEAEAAERVRLLYVALTRAANRLVIVGAWPADVQAKRKEWNHARSALDLLRHRAGAGKAIAELAQHAGQGDLTPVVDGFGAQWRLALELAAPAPQLVVGADGAQGETGGLLAPAAAADEARQLAREREGALAHMQRRYNRAASDGAHGEAAEVAAARRYRESDGEPEFGPISRASAQLVGTAVHRALEGFDLEADGETELVRWRADLERGVAESVGEREGRAAVERGLDLLERFARGPLLSRLRELSGRIVARELAVLLPPDGADAAGPVAYVSGAIDLLYRDPQTDQLVVVDYKTDAVQGAQELRERAAMYAPQGRAYVEALTQALGLLEPPRFELWFLHSGAIVAAEAS